MDFGYSWLKFVLGAYLKLLGIKAVVTGLANVPPGPKIIVGNHPHASDSFHLLYLIKEKVVALVDEDAMKTRVVGGWLRRAGQITVVPGRGKEALQTAQTRLMEGAAILIYPEAKLTSTHQVTRAGTGIARLALGANVPIVPLGFFVPERDVRVFHGHTREGRPTVGAWQFRGKTYINFGTPLNIPRDEAETESYRVYRRLTDQIMKTIYELAEQARQVAGGKSQAKQPPQGLEEA